MERFFCSSKRIQFKYHKKINNILYSIQRIGRRWKMIQQLKNWFPVIKVGNVIKMLSWIIYNILVRSRSASFFNGDDRKFLSVICPSLYIYFYRLILITFVYSQCENIFVPVGFHFFFFFLIEQLDHELLQIVSHLLKKKKKLVFNSVRYFALRWRWPVLSLSFQSFFHNRSMNGNETF